MAEFGTDAHFDESHSRKFRIRNVIVRVFSGYIRNFVYINIATLGVWLPLLLALGVLYLISESKSYSGDYSRLVFAMVVVKQAVNGSVFLMLLLYPISAAVIFHTVFRALRDGRVSFLTSVIRGVSRGFYIILLVLLLTFVFSLMIFIVMYPIVWIAPRPNAFWLLSLILPSYLTIIWLVAGPVSVVEGLGPIASLGRSRRLTLGNRWRLFVVLVIFAAIVGMAMTGLSMYANRMISTWQVVAMLTFVALIGGFICVVPAVVYHELRRAKEGRDIETLASVFD